MGATCGRSTFLLKLAISVALLFVMVAPAFATISVTPTSVAFANQAVGTTSPATSVTLTNLNTGEIEIVRVSCSVSQFSYLAPSLPVVLHTGQSLVVTVVFRPTSVQTYSGSLIFTRMNGSTVTVPLSGNGIQAPSSVAAPSITTQPANQSVIAGQQATFSVTASGTAPLAYRWYKNGVWIDAGSAATYTTHATTISDNGAQFTVTVSNSAGTVTSAPATLSVSSLPGTFSLSSSSLNFGSVNVGSSNVASTTLTNTGSSSITVSNVMISGAGFKANGISVGQIIGVGQAGTLSVTFAPAATGSVTGSVTISSNASNSPTAISLSGTGAAVSYSANLSWLASTSGVTGYNVYRSSVSGGPYAKLTSSMAPTTSYSDTAVQGGQTYYYVVTAVNSSGAESVYSNQASATIP